MEEFLWRVQAEIEYAESFNAEEFFLLAEKVAG